MRGRLALPSGSVLPVELNLFTRWIMDVSGKQLFVLACCAWCLGGNPGGAAANVVASQGRPTQEVTYCYFGALRRDGRIMVHMVEGAAGKSYRVHKNLPVTQNGANVGPRALLPGLPIILILDREGVVQEIQIRTGGGK
jgi:hypothetical protein